MALPEFIKKKYSLGDDFSRENAERAICDLVTFQQRLAVEYKAAKEKAEAEKNRADLAESALADAESRSESLMSAPQTARSLPQTRPAQPLSPKGPGI